MYQSRSQRKKLGFSNLPGYRAAFHRIICADLDEFKALAERWERGPDTNTPEARRAASLAVRAAVVDWPAAQQLLPLYDALDALELTPEDFLDLARLSLSQPLT